MKAQSQATLQMLIVVCYILWLSFLAPFKKLSEIHRYKNKKPESNKKRWIINCAGYYYRAY
jgi:hypothetical protein